MSKRAVLVLFDNNMDKAYNLYSLLNTMRYEGFLCEIWLFAFPDGGVNCKLYNSDGIVKIHVPYSYTPEETLLTLEQLCSQSPPDICIFENDIIGVELCTRIAYRQKATAINNCTNICFHKETDRISVRKPIYSGNVTAVYDIEKMPLYMTVKAEEFERFVPVDTYNDGDIKHMQYTIIEDDNYKIIKRHQIKKNPLLEAKIIIAVGQGLSNCTEVGIIKNIRSSLGVQIGASRPIVQNGWLTHTHLIGTTGINVSPELLITIGISGSGPFMEGAKYAKRIIAVNTNENAPIFKYADVGIQTDCHDLIAELEDGNLEDGYCER
ncbi:MAG: electron transfer flavoprotein subunit alpha/FixB family protein [Clostridia bacterium]|nr:electron transfer flavoprotein subunit alpha/FixB family protein [Clostridia bacterium]